MDILIKSLIISLACTGLRISSDKGMILYFLRWPYEYLQQCKKDSDHACTTYPSTSATYLISSRDRVMYQFLIYILKPLIGCITCMASVYTIVMELTFWNLSWWTIPTIFIVATMNSIIFSTYNKLTND